MSVNTSVRSGRTAVVVLLLALLAALTGCTTTMTGTASPTPTPPNPLTESADFRQLVGEFERTGITLTVESGGNAVFSGPCTSGAPSNCGKRVQVYTITEQDGASFLFELTDIRHYAKNDQLIPLSEYAAPELGPNSSQEARILRLAWNQDDQTVIVRKGLGIVGDGTNFCGAATSPDTWNRFGCS